MIRRKPSLISIATEETICFLMLSTDGSFKTLASLPLEDFLEGSAKAADLPKSALQSVNRLLVVPDYWMGSRFDEFQARKKSVITAFIERKLKLEQPALTEAGDFYNYAVVQDQDHRQQLYAFYLQEDIAYRLYRRLETLGISPFASPRQPRCGRPNWVIMADDFHERGRVHSSGRSRLFSLFFLHGTVPFFAQYSNPGHRR